MKKFFPVFLLTIFSILAMGQLSSIHSYTAKTIDGYTIPFTQFYGKKIMFVNTASYCAYTPQYGLLEQLYQNYKKYNFEILAFPCNDFGAQDPFADTTIKQFCAANYNVTFPLMSKVRVKIGDTSSIYRWLQQKKLNGIKDVSVDWNFNKFLINESGNWVAHYSSATSPMDQEIISWILSPTSINSTGLNSIDQSNDFVQMACPNPVNSFIQLILKSNETHSFQISLFSLDGKLLKSFNEELNSEPKKVVYPVSNLKDGIYFLRVTDGLHSKNLKVILEN